MGRRGLLVGLFLVTALAAVACQPVKKAPPAPQWIENPPGLPPAIVDGPAPPGSPMLTKADVVTGLSFPWDIAFLPTGEMFFDERASGTVKVRHLDETIEPIIGPHAPLANIPDLLVANEFFGVLGLAVDPDFASNPFIYVCYTADPPENDIRVVRWTLDTEFHASNPTPIVTGIPLALAPNLGCRVRFGPDEALWITTGDVHDGNVPQDLNRLGGKILRVDRNGNPYAGNPFGNEVYTYGHRNPQGIAFHPISGQPYSIEHGTNRDDEVNELEAGRNGGWDPKPGYNELVPMTDLVKFPNAMLPAWRSGDAGPPPNSGTIAPSGATFLSGAQWKSWDGALAVATLKGRHLRVMFLDGTGTVAATTSVLGNFGTRLRVPVQNPVDGDLYIATDAGGGNGAIWKITPT